MKVLYEHDIEVTEERYAEFVSQTRELLISVEEALPPDGKWALWLSKTGEYQIARFKEDAVNHFFPNAEFELEECVAWIALG